MSTPNPIQISRDQSGIPKYGIQMAQLSYTANVAAASSGTAVTVPGASNQFYDVLFETTPGASVLFSTTAAPTAPTGTFTAGAQELNPALRTIRGGATIYYYAIDAAVINICLSPQTQMDA